MRYLFIFLFLPVICSAQSISVGMIGAGYPPTSGGSSFTIIATNSKIGVGSGTNTTSNTNCTGADMIVVAVNTYTGSSTTAPTITDNVGGNIYTLVRYDDDDVGGTGTSRRGTAIYYCHAPTVSSTMKFSTTTTFTSLFVIAVSGSAASPLDQQNGNNAGGSTAIQPGSITPVQNGELIIDVVQGYIASTATPSTPTSFTLIGGSPYSAGNSYSCAAFYYIQPTSAAINPSSTFNVSEVSAQASITSFKHL